MHNAIVTPSTFLKSIETPEILKRLFTRAINSLYDKCIVIEFETYTMLRPFKIYDIFSMFIMIKSSNIDNAKLYCEIANFEDGMFDCTQLTFLDKFKLKTSIPQFVELQDELQNLFFGKRKNVHEIELNMAIRGF